MQHKLRESLAGTLIVGDKMIPSSPIFGMKQLRMPLTLLRTWSISALSGDIIAAIFYLKAQRPKFRDRLDINVEQAQSDIDEMMERLRSFFVITYLTALTLWTIQRISDAFGEFSA